MGRACRNLEGKTFGRLTVVRKTEMRRNGEVMWECRCECGATFLRRSSRIGFRKQESCGRHAVDRQVRDHRGKKFGWLTAIEQVPNPFGRKTLWRCVCRCGEETTVVADHLVSGNSGSCGCRRGRNKEQQIAYLREVQRDRESEMGRAVAWPGDAGPQ